MSVEGRLASQPHTSQSRLSMLCSSFLSCEVFMEQR